MTNDICSYIREVANQSENKSHVSYCVTAKSHIIHINTTPSVLAQATKHAFTQCACKPHPGFQGEQFVQNFATSTRLNTALTFKSRIKPGKEPYAPREPQVGQDR